MIMSYYEYALKLTQGEVRKLQQAAKNVFPVRLSHAKLPEYKGCMMWLTEQQEQKSTSRQKVFKLKQNMQKRWILIHYCRFNYASVSRVSENQTTCFRVGALLWVCKEGLPLNSLNDLFPIEMIFTWNMKNNSFYDGVGWILCYNSPCKRTFIF